MNSKPIGITFSHLHLKHLGLDVDEAFKKALTFKFSHLRLGCYWSEIETEKNKYNFEKIEQFLEKCETANQPVILTVGSKAPRWPEFYWPDYLQNKNPHDLEARTRIINFIEKTIKKLDHYNCITHWQIENEPLDPSGPAKLTISAEFLNQEIEAAKTLTNKHIIINFWGNDFLNRKLFKKTANQKNITIGLDLYPKQFVKKILGKNLYKGYLGLHQPQNKLIETLKKLDQPIIITELQAEPWEENEQAYLAQNPQSISPNQLEKNIADAQKLPINEIMLWGFEYWLWQAKNGNYSYMELIKKNL